LIFLVSLIAAFSEFTPSTPSLIAEPTIDDSNFLLNQMVQNREGFKKSGPAVLLKELGRRPLSTRSATALAPEERCARKAGIEELAPHDLRTCARLCHAAGGELEQIQFLLGHMSIQTTERYLGWKQRIRSAANDRIGIEPPPLSGLAEPDACRVADDSFRIQNGEYEQTV
jgi:hypothetical protein